MRCEMPLHVRRSRLRVRVKKLMLDPDDQIQSIVRLVFDTFRRTGSAGAVVRYFREQAIAWPQRVATGPRAGTFVAGTLGRSRVLGMLHNPRPGGVSLFPLSGPGGRCSGVPRSLPASSRRSRPSAP